MNVPDWEDRLRIDLLVRLAKDEPTVIIQENDQKYEIKYACLTVSDDATIAVESAIHCCKFTFYPTDHVMVDFQWQSGYCPEITIHHDVDQE